MRILEVSSKSQHKAFLKLPFQLYKDDPLWIPNLKQDIEKVFDPAKNKLFRTGELARWVALDDAHQPVGRIAAFVNPKTANTWDQPTGGIGFFECINDQRVAATLFDMSKTWLSERGMEAMDGPINFGEKNMFWGLLAENFEHPPTYGMNHNPPYYKDLFEGYGFKVFYKQLMYHRNMYEAQPDIIEKAERLVAEHPDVHCTNARGMRIDQIADAFMQVYNEAWGNHEGFEPVTIEQARKGMKSIKPVMDPDIMLYAWDGDKPIGFYTSLPELNEIFRHIPRGNLNVIGKLIFLWHKKRHTSKRMLGLVFGVHPDYQGKGVEALMIKFASENIVPLNRYKDTVMAWVGDFNPKMHHVLDNLGAKLWRVFHTYRYLFDRNKPFERHPMLG